MSGGEDQAAIADVAKVEALVAQVKALTDERDVLVTARKSALDEVTGKLTAEVTAHAETGKTLAEAQKTLAEAQKKLADPAYKMASAPGDSTTIPEGGAPAATGVSLVAQMKAIDDPVKRAEFYHANMEAIKAELK